MDRDGLVTSATRIANLETLEDQSELGQENFLGRYEIYKERSDRLVYMGPVVFVAFVQGTCPRSERYEWEASPEDQTRFRSVRLG